MARFRPIHLFSDFDLREYLEATRSQMRKQIEQYHPNKLLNTPVDDLAEYFAALGTVEPIELDEAGATVDQAETKVDVSHRFEYDVWDHTHPHYVAGTSLSLHVPFTGDPKLLRCRASTFSYNPPYAQVTDSEVIFEHAAPRADAEEVKRYFEKELVKLRQYTGWVNQDVSQHNAAIPVEAHRQIESRKQRLLSNQNLVASLGFPLRERPDAPKTYAIPDVRKKPVPSPPPASTAPFAPEPALSDAVYDQILTIMSNMVRVMEQSPAAFATMGEEDLRTHFLVQLNGQFEGRASGETFHGSGSTDILLREQDKSVFIAECKFWDGPTSLSKAIDQLLDYATWRDAKAALLVFSRNKDFSAVVAQVPDVLREHPNTKGDVIQVAETVFRCKLRLRDDPVREMTLTTLVYNVPTERTVSDRLKPHRVG